MVEGGKQSNLLFTFLAEQDVPCPQCGYNLRALTGNNCPECGDQIKLSVQLVEPKQAAAIVGLIGLSGGVGFNALLLLYIFAVKLFQPTTGTVPPKFFLINLGGLIVTGMCLYFWLKHWRQIRTIQLKVRWLLAVGIIVLPILDLFVFSWGVR